MTALNPIESRRVRGVPATKYPMNEQCAHPDCWEDAVDGHHIFPRSRIGNSSWFVEIVQGVDKDESTITIPHVTGLCRTHHDAVELHKAWIKLEDGEFVWFDRVEGFSDGSGLEDWEVLGPLVPQPGGRERKKRRPRRKTRDEKGQRLTHTIRFPDTGEEPSIAEQYATKVELVEAIFSGEAGTRSEAMTIVEAFDYVLLNATPEG